MNNKLEKIYNKNVKNIPYEGLEIDRENLVNEIYNQAIEDYTKALTKYLDVEEKENTGQYIDVIVLEDLDEFADKLKLI